MKIVLKSKEDIIDKEFVKHLSKYMYDLMFVVDKDAKKKLNKFNEYLRENIFTGRRIYSANQVIRIAFNNLKVIASGKEGSIEINPTREIPFYKFKIKDIVALIDEGNLDIKGTHLIHDLYKYIQDNIHLLREQYEQGLF